METFLFSKSVDQSLLKSGLTVPKEVCEKMQTSLGIMLKKGDQRNISVKIDDKFFEGIYVKINDHISVYNDEILYLGVRFWRRSIEKSFNIRWRGMVGKYDMEVYNNKAYRLE